MANNTITIHYTPCGTAPASGYVVFYRPVGGGDYRESQNFFESPIIIVDTNDPFGTEYEGYLQSDCGGGKLGPQIPWTTVGGGGSASGSESESEPPPVVNSGQLVVTSTNVDLSIVGIVNVTHEDIDYPVTAQVDFGTWEDFGGGNIQVNLSVQADGFCRLLKNGVQIDIQPFTEFQGFVTFTGVAAYADGDVMEINVQLT